MEKEFVEPALTGLEPEVWGSDCPGCRANGYVSITCSNKPRPSVQRGRGFYKTGEAAWGRDVFHVQKSGMTTLCGRDCSEWLRMDARKAHEALADGDLCARCAAILKATSGSRTEGPAPTPLSE